MYPILAAGLFDNPWIVAVIIVGGALINWLSQRRQAKQQGEPPPEGAAPTSPKKASEEFNMEEALRRLLGEQVVPPSPAPPPIPRASQEQRPASPAVRRVVPTAPPVRTRLEDSREGYMSVLSPPPIAVARPVALSAQGGTDSDRAAMRFEQLNEQGRHPAVAHGLRRHSRSGAWGSLWRDRRSVRRAFVASLVFGPPKGLEP